MMAATPKELEYQTMTSVGKVSVTNDSTAILLGLIGFSATKLLSLPRFSNSANSVSYLIYASVTYLLIMR